MFDQQLARLDGADDHLKLPFSNLAIALFESPYANKLSQRQRIDSVSLQLGEHFTSLCSSSGEITLVMQRDGMAQSCLGRRSIRLRVHRGLETEWCGCRLGAVSLPALRSVETWSLLT